MYPAKVLLYGEHTVLRGGRGLAVPYAHRGLEWTKDRPDERLLSFCDYLRVAFSDRHLLDTNALEDYLTDDWRLTGDIPTGYGLGSSGAVCAAIWDRFATPAGKFLSGEALRKALARMEQHFHGSSSGTDPLVCYLQRPVSLGNGTPQPVDLPVGWNDRFFLVDTGHDRQASRLIRNFTQRYDTDTSFAKAVDQHWKQPANLAIQALLNDQQEELGRQTRLIGDFQLKFLPDFIPDTFHDRWQSKDYALKICGAGGGGMVLGYLMNVGARTKLTGLFDGLEWL